MGQLFEGGVRVPLIISGPGIKNGSESDVRCLDLIYLTIIELAGNESFPIKDTDEVVLCPILLNKDKKQIKRSVDGIFFHVPYKNSIETNRPHSARRQSVIN